MKKTIAAIFILVLTAASLAALMPAKAQARTIIVPDDYPTIQTAINAASTGDTVFFRKGTHDGPINQTLVIDKSISLIGENAEDTVIKLHPIYNVTWIFATPFFDYTDAIRIDANDVTIFNLTLTYIGHIRINGERVQIVRNSIRSQSTSTGLILKGSNCSVANNFVLGTITLESGSNIIAQNEFNALQIMSANNNLVESNNFNYLGIYSSTGNIISKNNVSTELVSYAVSLVNSSHNVFHYNNVTVSAWNTNVGIESNSRDNTFYMNGFFYDYANLDVNPDFDRLYNNKKLVSSYFAGNSISTNFWDNGKEGNYWQNYNGTDANRDGIGDTPYIINENNTDNYPLMRPVNVSLTPPTITPVPIPPVNLVRIKFVSSSNQTYNVSSVSFVFTVGQPTNWTGYSLDGKENITVTGNFTLTDLKNGSHNLTVYANDTYGNMGASEPVSFTVAVPERFPFVPFAVAAVAVIAIVAVAGLLLYRRKRRREAKHA